MLLYVLLHTPFFSLRFTGVSFQVPLGQVQPTPVQWMVAPPALPDVPPGLEYMLQLDQILIQQQIELLECKCSEM